MNFLSKICIPVFVCVYTALSSQNTFTYSYTGSLQTFTVPTSCVSTISVDIRGAQGANAIDKLPTNANGGLGGRTVGVLSVTPGQVLYIYVGEIGNTNGNGGYNGGATGGTSTAGSSCFGGPAGGGGGASDIRMGGTGLNNRVAVAGGGGGAGRDYCNGTCQPCGCGGSGGCGGGITGAAGQTGYNCGFGYPAQTGEGGGSQSGQPGGATSGGGGGVGSGGGNAGFAGTLGQGGGGANGLFDIAGGGGGGGYYGGGGGGAASNGNGVAGAGGGGGSGYTGGLISGTTTSCFQGGNGLVILSYSLTGNGITASASSMYICAGSSVQLNASGQNTYTWSIGSNASSLIVTPSINTTYYVSGTNSLGCISYTLLTIQVDESVLSVSAASVLVCQGNTVSLIASGASSYTWSGGVTNAAPFTPTVTSTYTVSGTNSCGTATAVSMVSVVTSPTVSASANTTTLCATNTLILNAFGASSYTWSNGVLNGVPFTPNSTAAYTVTGTSAPGCTASAVITVTVQSFTGPSLSVSTPSLAMCAGNMNTLTANGVNTYTWNTGSNASSILISPSSGTLYSVQGTNSSGCISNTLVFINVSPAIPILNLNTPSVSVCPGSVVNLGASGATTFSWTGGLFNGVPFTPTATATYTVIGYNACGSASATAFVQLNAAPALTVSVISPTVCSGNTVNLLATGATSYSWSGGVLNGVSFSPQSSNVYTVIGMSAQGCTANTIASVTVVTTPTQVPVLSSSLICSGSTVNLIATGASNYTWMPGNINLSSISVSPSVSTTYTLIKSNSNCINSQTLSVQVNPLPFVVAQGTPSQVCASTSCALLASGALSYTWFPMNQSGATLMVYPTTTTVYTVSASDGTCISSATTQVLTIANPSLSISHGASVICTGQSTSLSVNGATNYTWMPGSINSQSLLVNPMSSTLYSVVGTTTFGCKGQAAQYIQVNQSPALSISVSSTLVCPGGSISLYGSGANTYSWSTGQIGATISLVPAATSVYTLIGTSAAGCVSEQTIALSVFNPSFTVNGPITICAGNSATLSASGAQTYTWLATGNPFPSITVFPTISTVYLISATTSSNFINCNSTQSIGVTVNPNPTVSVVSTKTIVCKGENAILNASGAVTYTWSTAQSGASIITSPTITTNYTVTGTSTEGCVHQTTLSIKVSACSGLLVEEADEPFLSVIPNPSNGEFFIESNVEADMLLMNELGQVLNQIQLNSNNQKSYKFGNLAVGVYYLKSTGNVNFKTKVILVLPK